jgi:hypothetical protein
MKQIQWTQFLATAAACVLFSCKPEPSGQLQVEVQTVHADLGTGVSNIELFLERRVLDNGILNGNYEPVANSLTDVSGRATLNFQRVNALNYRLTAAGMHWFPWIEEINPDIFIENEKLSIEQEMMPSALVQIHLVNTNPFQSDDEIEFRTLNIPSEYPTCSNAWEAHVGLNVDVQRSCFIEADRYLPYIYRIYRNNEWTETIDSLFISQGDSALIHIAW